MKRILVGLVTIAVVSVVGLGVTRAYFSDTETSKGNTITTGTIKIAVDGQNPWNRETPYQLTDMKPGETGYANFTVQNVGTNPVNVLKRIDIATPSAGVTLESVIKYDLNVELFQPGGTTPVWHQMLYNNNATVADIKGKNLFLGMVPVGWSLKVTQSYHMDENAGNEYQGKSITFDITLTGEQLKGTAILEDKTGDPDWLVKAETAARGTLTYDVKDSKFNFSFTGVAPLPSTNYSLIMYEESWSTPSDNNWPRAVVVLGSGISDGSNSISINGNPDTGSMTNAKIWLVKTSDLSGNTQSGWSPADYLFDTGLIDYYKSGL